MPAADLSSDYLKRQLIAYIGNKRRLLPSLHRLFLRLEKEHPVRSMLDPFAGSGAAARLGRSMGYQVFANDWEEYSRLINGVYLRLTPSRVEGLFSRYGGLRKLLAKLNSYTGSVEEPYFSLYYAPRSTEDADYRTERLFYTRENALFLDHVRGWIEREYPSDMIHDEDMNDERELLIALLLYEAATHANTSGVFKACHKGFGGHGSDALKRIMAPMELEYPVLLDGPIGQAGSMDAGDWVCGKSADLCYLDPPYTIHQYGSNYHMLNSVALWDRPDAPLDLKSDGRLRRKAGIREDWIQTRSPYCTKKFAAGALKKLLAAIDARYIVLSYNSDGIISLDELCQILSERGRLSVYADDYVQYRGGKQGLNRRNLTIEFQLLVENGTPHRKKDGEKIRRFIKLQELGQLLQGGFHPRRLAATGLVMGGVLNLGSIGSLAIPLKGGFKPDSSALEPEDFFYLTNDEIDTSLRLLKDARFHDNREEAEILLEILTAAEGSSKDIKAVTDRFLLVLKKLAHKKYLHIYKEIYAHALSVLCSADAAKRLETLNRVALRRFSG
ncbi:DNA adenine methylase [Marispirochaeta sp.]|uniref:DNA adenine methylase n=1 Tax=Marispirochaeta sp. TaxID=2038653 RepID=UPI0029C9860B|nr:DNA adenine methylase [Marispirochaeta sp.]